MIRTNHLIDPHLHIWGWEIPVYLFLGGLTAGIMVVTSILSLKYPKASLSRWARWMPFAAPILLSVGMLALLLDLEHKLYVWRFYLAFEVTSPISWGAWILLLIYPAALLLGLINLTSEERSGAKIGPLPKILDGVYEAVADYRTIIIWANIILGVGLGTYTGIFLGSLGARALWSSPILGPLFLVSGLSTAMALMMLFSLSEEEHHDLLKWDQVAIVVELVLIGIYLLGLITSGSAVKIDAAHQLLKGDFGTAFLVLVVFLGLLIPIALELAESRLKKFAAITAPLLILIGGFALRWILVYAGQV